MRHTPPSRGVGRENDIVADRNVVELDGLRNRIAALAPPGLEVVHDDRVA
jgi:hypothetical protein